MESFSPMRRYFVFFLIIGLACLLRFYQLGPTASFGYDSARDMINLREMILSHKMTLIGPETTIGDKTIFFGPLHYYINAPALLISGFNPLATYYWTAILSLFAVIIIAIFTKNPIATLFVAVFPWLISSSQAAWNPNLVPLFAVLGIGLFKKRQYFWSGLACGLAIQLHYMASLMPLLLALLLLFRWRSEGSSFLKLFLGIVIGVSPLIIFDLRHQFFLAKTITSIGQADVASRTLGWYYFLWVPVAAAFVIHRLPKLLTLVLIILSLTATFMTLSEKQPDPQLGFAHVKKVANQVLNWEKTASGNYNIASLSDPDARATAYRYYLIAGGKPPLSFREYSVSDHVYAVVPRGITDQTILAANTYEVAIFKPLKVTQRKTIGSTDLVRLDYR